MTFHVDLAGAEFDGSLKRAAENPRSEINGLRLERDTKPAVAYKNTWLLHGGGRTGALSSGLQPAACSLYSLFIGRTLRSFHFHFIGFKNSINVTPVEITVPLNQRLKNSTKYSGYSNGAKKAGFKGTNILLRYLYQLDIFAVCCRLYSAVTECN